MFCIVVLHGDLLNGSHTFRHLPKHKKRQYLLSSGADEEWDS
ncbi:hypothetical protein CLOBOL_05807 [Enterocloster bolteae ATCC BAA-613]|uniref:Uncharacterized protein n=1 Tax=Enterocloster bolteae (strain ATCC BAA-613 / DSM 15670 / CCUG 46953 / JCM 12243 / WAL 16351) TaxID=411902 RepID=A8S0Y6_ENTBW|nr:hypothetical protein CLOBOL_05807 [Enterocloster bolteae ATCC BAA-613]